MVRQNWPRRWTCLIWRTCSWSRGGNDFLFHIAAPGGGGPDLRVLYSAARLDVSRAHLYRGGAGILRRDGVAVSANAGAGVGCGNLTRRADGSGDRVES